jgi:hypothetical protein
MGQMAVCFQNLMLGALSSCSALCVGWRTIKNVQSLFEHALYKLPEDGTDVPKHVVLVKDHTFKCVCNLCIKVIL